MCHKPISELSPELQEIARKNERLLLTRLSEVGQKEVGEKVGISESGVAKFNPDDCKFCNNTNGICCHEVIMTDEKTPCHIIDPQDEHHHDEADAHVFMMNGLLVAKDVAMAKAGV